MFNQGLKQEGAGLTESRFNMWRAVVAMAHTDGRIVPEEREMILSYLDTVPFSPRQRERLAAELDDPADARDCLAGITNPEDRGLFFQFASALLWTDGDYAEAEEALLEHLKGWHLEDIGWTDLEEQIETAKEDGLARRLYEDKQFAAAAREAAGLGAFLKALLPGI